MSPRREPLPATKFTPAPWELETIHGEVRAMKGEHSVHIAGIGHGRPMSRDEWFANGYLIAQSPTLYSLLESALPMLEAHSTPGFRAKVLKALAMARGENSTEVNRG